MFYFCVSARTVLTTREALIFTCSSVTVDALQQVVIITLVAGHEQVAACRSYILRLRIPVGRARIPGHRCDPVGHDDALVAVLGAENAISRHNLWSYFSQHRRSEIDRGESR